MIAFKRFWKRTPQNLSAKLCPWEPEAWQNAAQDLHVRGYYDRYISLGSNCEVGFQLKRVLGEAESGFFNWNITESDALISLLENNFLNILKKRNLSLHAGGSLVRDISHNFMVHHDFDLEEFHNAQDFDEKLENLCEKFAYFVEKFRKEAVGPGLTAYFYLGNVRDAREFAIRVHELLKSYHAARPFSLILLQTSENEEPDWGLPGIYNRYLKRFAPYSDTPDAHIPSWDAVFREFPHRKPLRFVDY